ncbi:E3 ubiquitin-protein ligase UBR3 [Holothuria leucospilota]|uniref:E3 ubiquitin-protein ligase n=1 Tax=Holothuria leucospilota TaxID=206669 RepID=A0A9Q0YM38_HOLLE|nr:E3 ubiquitin-protein ligase UBR3 [Holothuria leucospilota]
MAEKLLRMEPERLSALLKSECLQSDAGKARLLEIIEHLVNVHNPIQDMKIRLLENLVAGDMSFETFVATIKTFDDSLACGLVWTADFVAYRCRTCGISPCMSICADCFHGADHTGHDFNMFRSLAGGACDCGDTSVMKSSGFCSEHSLDKPQRVSSVPKHLVVTAEIIIPRLLWRLVQHFRISYVPPQLKALPSVTKDASPLLTILDKLTKMGGVMRKVIVDALLGEDIYTELMNDTRSDDPLLRDGYLAYKSAMGNLVPPDFSSLVSSVPSYPAFEAELQHHNFVGELLFWTAVYNFPQEMITFLLSMLPDNVYKEKFTTIFLKHYIRIAMTLKGKTNPNHVVHISVQLFSNETLAKKMVTDMGLLHVLCLSGLSLLKPALVSSPLMAVWPDGATRKTVHQVLNCDSKILKDQCYWPIVSDFSNILSHRSVASHFFKDDLLMQLWCRFLTMFMGMNLNKRELGYHVEYEPNLYSTAFAAEIEGCAAPMWQIASHCREKTTMLYTVAFTKELQAALIIWLDKLNIEEKLHPLQVSFHIPLIRYLSVMLKQGINDQGMKLSTLIRSPGRLRKLMIFPLQIMAVINEVYCGMWVRNGLQMKCQAMTYLQCHFCASMADLDLYFLQVCAAYLNPQDFPVNDYMKSVLDRFKALKFLTFDPNHRPQHMDSNQEMAMVEAALTFIATLVSIRTNLGMSSDEALRQEMVSLLCMEDRTYSKLQDKIPEKTGVINTNCKFEETLAEIADYQLPTSDMGGLHEGKYSPKAEIWEKEFDPLHVMFRSMERKDFQSAMDNYFSYLKRSGKYQGHKLPWPPFQPLKPVHKEYAPLRQILNNRVLHALLYSILYKAVHTSSVSESAIYMTVALINMALQCVPDETLREFSGDEPIIDTEPEKWFHHDSILHNLSMEIKGVRYQINSRKSVADEKEMEAKQFSYSTSNQSQFLATLMVEGQWVELMNTQVTGDGSDPDDEWVNIFTTMMETTEGGAEEVAMEIEDQATGESRSPDLLDLDEQHTKEDTEDKVNAKRQRKETPPPEFVTKPLNESMISLLMKLYEKLSVKEDVYLPPSIRGTDHAHTGVLYGQGPDYIQNILDKACTASSSCQAVAEGLCKRKGMDQDEVDSVESSPKALESRRRRSTEAKQKMIEKLASQQKQFLKKAFEGYAEFEDTDETDSSKSPEKQPEYECVICSQVGPTSEDNPYGMCVLMQTTKVLGHRKQNVESETLPLRETESAAPIRKRCHELESRRWDDAIARFPKASCLSSFGVSWDYDVHVQTCGHCIHIKCLKSYTESIGANHRKVHDLLARHLNINAGEYECPICRQLANSILPCPVPREATSLSKYSLDNMSKLILQILKRLGSASRQLNLGKSDFDVAVFKFVEDLFRQLPIESRKAARQDEGGSFAYLCSLARINVELDLVRREGNLCLSGTASAKSSDKKLCLGLLLNAFSCYLEKSPKISMSNLWQRLTRLHKPSKSDSADVVPVVLRDPIALLFLFVFHLPQPITNDHLKCLVLVLYNLVHVQALTRISCKLSAADCNAYLRPEMMASSGQSEMSVLLGHIVQHLTHLRHDWLYGDFVDPQDYCTTVWSPQAIQENLQKECLPFLRVAALLQHVMFNSTLPQIESSEEEFAVLLQYVGVVNPPTDSAQQVKFTMHSEQCLKVTQDNPLALVRLWCEEFNHFLYNCYVAEKNIKVPKSMLLYSPVFNLPRLMRLPEDYSQLFEYYRRQICKECNTKPHKPAICLVCGKLVCWGSPCCIQVKGSRKYTEGILHAKECGSDTAVYLEVDSSVTLLVQGQRLCRWASLYLDSHGEEDRGLRRGRPLYLSQQRFDLLEQLWQSMSLKHFCKGWEWHLGGHT